MKALLATIALVSGLYGLNASASAPLCADVFAPASYKKVYAAGVDRAANPGGYIQIGYESEYLFSESAAILRDYCPKDISYQNWLAKTDEQRVAWLNEKFKDKPEHAAGSGLFKQVDIDFLPNELLIDATGNAEIVTAPFNSYGEWESAVDTIVSRYGAGSQQAMMSKPGEAAFEARAALTKPQLVKQSLGWLVYTNLRDMFAKLESGAQRYQKDPTKLTAQFMEHPFLGPMTKMKRDRMEEFLTANSNGQMFDDASKYFIRKSDASFKYTGGPAYRPDVVGPARFAWEIRNAHKDVADLKMKVARDMAAHAAGLGKYESFADVPAFDSLGLFERFSPDVQKGLVEIFPSKADPRFDYPQAERTALETARHFALPLQDFTALSTALIGNSKGAAAMQARIGQSRLAYIKSVHDAVSEFKSGKLTRDQARAKIMGAVGNFAVDSGLAHAFDVRASLIGHEPMPSAAPAKAKAS
jgi:hypothetical protein